MLEFIETKELFDIEVLSEIGYIPIKKIHKTNKQKIYIVLFESL